MTYVAVSRPHYLDTDITPVSDGIKRLVAFIDQTENCTRRKIFDALAPTKVIAVSPPVDGGSAEPVALDEASTEEAPAEETAPAPKPEVSPEMKAVNADLHWLIHQGHVLELSNGVIESAKKPRPRPEQQPKKKTKKNPGRGTRKGLIFIDPTPLLIG
ncbi:MAG: hypothetical protein ISQ14_05905 [Verrucomicrobiae bacterium]|nr:hypothetical protein [Verrucomicrobiae bacterium]